MRPKPDATVMAWFGQQVPAKRCTTIINQAEMLYRLYGLTDGKKKGRL
ncbi:MAG: hypothetical protein OXE94_05110 [Aestuariivita sp.]|nr:hypothetical protein [Aestuariivita sp.]MCY4201959.1 hypothetical protein [Aestuariivita sp.]